MSAAPAANALAASPEVVAAMAELNSEFSSQVKPLLKQYCLGCHSTEEQKGELDLERFVAIDSIRQDLKPWQGLIEQLETREMPPKDKPQPSDDQRRLLVAWTRRFLDAEAKSHAGDPGRVGLRRLSNAEYDATIRDLTGVDLRPAREFPADGAAGEGFTNAAEALGMSPVLLGKYLAASKEIAAHAVLLPDGMRFSPSKTRRDWTDESVAALRQFYAPFGPDGKLPLLPYLAATVRYRSAIETGMKTLEGVAATENLSPRYLATLWMTLNDSRSVFPLDSLRSRWKRASEADVAGLVAEIAAWQDTLWKFSPIGSMKYGALERQSANYAAAPTQTLRFKMKPSPGQTEVTLFLAARELLADKPGSVAWQRPRFEGANLAPLLLRDYPQFGPGYEVDHSALFGSTATYLRAVQEAANTPGFGAEVLARKHAIDAALLERWIDLLALEPMGQPGGARRKYGRRVPLQPLTLLREPAPNATKPVINGWRAQGADLPLAISNASDHLERVPGDVQPHHVAVHPTPSQFVAAAWKSPIAGTMQVSARVQHAHPGCGNGVAWWLEHRTADRALVLAEGFVGLGQAADVAPLAVQIDAGDVLLLTVDANKDHGCDLTDISLTITDRDQATRQWDLATDVANTIAVANPHADRLGNADVWSFVMGPTRETANANSGANVAADSVLGRWRQAASDPARQNEAAELAQQAQTLFTGGRPTNDKDPNQGLFDSLNAPNGPLLRGLDRSRLARPEQKLSRFGLPAERFGRRGDTLVPGAENNLFARSNAPIEIKLPAALFEEREFVVDAQLDGPAEDRAVRVQVLTALPATDLPYDGKGAIVAATGSPAAERLAAGFTEFRRVFPVFVCFPNVIPLDEVVCLKAFHREDEPLKRLLLSAADSARIDRLWEEHRFISRFPATENEYLPLFIGFVTQDQPKELLDYFETLREPFRQRAEAFEREEADAFDRQWPAVLEFAARAWRHPLDETDRQQLATLYQTLRNENVSPADALHTVLERTLVSPRFLYHWERPAAGEAAAPVDNWELAARLSYFLWSSVPDEELRSLAAAGRLSEPPVLAQQTDRMLRDPRVRSLAIEFGTQWLHVRGFDELKEKNERLFPEFDAELRSAIYEESILFFQDLFQGDRALSDLLDADYTFLNERLARHYNIPNVSGAHWRRVDGVKQFGRGGILGLASVLTAQSGASRTSPVLRGNWVVETLLGEKLPRPPANVPRLPEEETGNAGLTMRQLVEAHVRAPECAVCHVRIDPLGFALEKYDPIGRLREKDLGGLPVDAHSKVRDGNEFEGLGGLRGYLMGPKGDIVQRLFCRRLLGYALGRTVTVSDQPLVDEMLAAMARNNGHVSAAVQTIVASNQFRMIRGSGFDEP